MKKILVLHGALGSNHQTRALCTILNGHFDVEAFEFRGHGGASGNDLQFDLDILADDLLEYIERDQLRGIDVFGYSMGGYVAAIAARKSPGSLGKIITLGTKWNWDPESTDKEVANLNADVIEEKVPNFAKYLMMQHGTENWRTLLNATADMMIGLGTKGKALTAQDLNALDNDFLILRGELDKMVSTSESQWAAESLPKATYREVPAQPHPLEKVDASKLLPIVSSFLNG